MTCSKDEIVYQNTVYRVYDLLKKMELSIDAYRAKRNAGFSIEEAFYHCINVKRKQNCRRDKKILELAKATGFSKKVFYEGFYKEKPVQQIIKEQERKKEKSTETLEYLYRIGLPKEYSSLRDFCRCNSLNVKNVQQNISNDMTLYDAVLNSYGKDIHVFKYIFLNIQLKSLAQKYSLDYDQITSWIRNGKDYREAIARDVFARSFSKNLGGRLNYLWNIYNNTFLSGKKVEEMLSEEELESFVTCYSKMRHMQRDFSYYSFLNKINISSYLPLSIDDRVKKGLQVMKKEAFSLTELYYILDFENGLMADFTYLSDLNIWVYSGNREVLAKIKKSSC